MIQSPILRHESWQGLISELALRDGLVFLRGISVPVASAVLAAPAARELPGAERTRAFCGSLAPAVLRRERGERRGMVCGA